MRACPFLLLPKAQYRTIENPNVRKLPGSLKTNPGVCCLYTVRGYASEQRPRGMIFRTGRAVRVDWYTQGRAALRSEVLEAIDAELRAIDKTGNAQAIERRVAELVPA